ncbi:ST5 protein, partial [Polypterus senegalus]
MGSSCFPALLRRHALVWWKCRLRTRKPSGCPLSSSPQHFLVWRKCWVPGFLRHLGAAWRWPRAPTGLGFQALYPWPPIQPGQSPPCGLEEAQALLWSSWTSRPGTTRDILASGRRLAVATGPYRAGLPSPVPEAPNISRTDAPSRSGGGTSPGRGPQYVYMCHSASPPPVLSPAKVPTYPLSDSEEFFQKSRYAKTRFLSLSNWSNKNSTLRSSPIPNSDSDPQNRLLKSLSIGCLDTKIPSCKNLAENKDQKENLQESSPSDGISSNQLGRNTLSLRSSANHKSLSLSRTSISSHSFGIQKRISEWEGRNVAPCKMSLCLDKRPLGERVGSEGCPSLLSSPCSEKTFDFKGVRRMSRTFSECSYPETEEEESLDKETPSRFEKRLSKSDMPNTFHRSSPRKGASAVLNRIQKIEQALKESPTSAPPQFPSSCYGTDKVNKKSFTIGTPEDSESISTSKRSSISSVITEPDLSPGSEKITKIKQRFSMCSGRSCSPDLLLGNPSNTEVNPVPKPKRTFEYEADQCHKEMPNNGIPPTQLTVSPPPLPSTPAPPVTRRQKKDGSFPRKGQNRKSLEFEDASSLQSSYPSSPTENGTVPLETQSRLSSKGTLEENAYEDIAESSKENPYEDVDLKGRHPGRKSKMLSENSRHSLHRMWTPQHRKYTTAPQLPLKPSSQSLRLPGASERKSQHITRLSKRHSHDDMLLLPHLDENSESESDSDDRFKAHTQRLVHLQSMLKRAPSYRTLELELIEWQERELFEYFVVVSLRKKPSKNTYIPEVSYQFPKVAACD